jgi:hypothetical protein
MGAIAFVHNYTDHSNDTGYQFEFHCDKCGNGYRSTFHGSTLGMGSKLARGLGSLFGGGFSAAAQAGEYMKDGLRGPQWDSAFREAIEEIKPKFHQCTRCGHWVCPEVCWNAQRGMCMDCAPDLEREAASAQAHIAAQQAETAMSNVNQIEGFDPKAQHGIGLGATCASCHAQVAAGAKFCASCGKPVVAARVFCTWCGTQLAAGAKFCSGCGTPAGG